MPRPSLWKGAMGRPAKNAARRRELLASGDIPGEFGVRVPGPMLLEMQRRAARELIPVSELVRRALQEKFLRDDGK
jgi:hypothetical protein